MKKKILSYFFVTAFVLIAIVTGITKYQENQSLLISDLALSNIEALAQDESKECKGGKCEFTDNMGNTCKVCCEEGQRAECDVFGCRCM